MSDDNRSPLAPIDGVMPPPSGSERDGDYITRDLEFLLHRAVGDLLDRVASARGIDRRHAVPVVLRLLRELGQNGET
jgi:hypothetical protein